MFGVPWSFLVVVAVLLAEVEGVVLFDVTEERFDEDEACFDVDDLSVSFVAETETLELVLAEVSSADVELLSAFSVVVVVEELEITSLIKDSISLIGMLLPFSSRTVISTVQPLMSERQRTIDRIMLSFFTIFPPRPNA